MRSVVVRAVKAELSVRALSHRDVRHLQAHGADGKRREAAPGWVA